MGYTKFSFKDTLKENLGLAVYNTGYEVCQGGHKWGPAVRDHYLLHYVRSGKGEYTYGGKTFRLQAGDMFIVFPSTLVCYTADKDDPWEYCWVGFNGTEAKRMVQLTPFSERQPIFQVPDGTRLEDWLMNIYRSSGNTPAADAAMGGYLYLFLGELMQHAETRQQQSTVQDYLTQALRYIQYNYATNLSVEKLAAYVGVSRSQLYRAFMDKFELSPHDFIKRYRISESCALLRETRLSVAEVASSVGFSDSLYFSRVFKKIKGMAPTEFCRTCRASMEE